MKTPSDIILAQLGMDDSLVDYRDEEPQTTLEKIVDGSKAQRDLDMRTTVGLEEGIARTIAWQREVYCA
jgi:dTDP-glucose 4,6-dehydratase